MAVVEYIEGELDAPPPELRFVLRVNRWGNPTGGGWHDWPAGMVRRAGYADSVYRSYSAYKSSAGHTTQWANRNPQAFELVSQLLEQRMAKLRTLENGDPATSDY